MVQNTNVNRENMWQKKEETETKNIDMYVKNSKRIHAASPGQNSSIISRVFCMIHAHNRLTELVAIQDNIENRKLKKSRIK